MSIFPIRKYGDPVLRSENAEVLDFDDRLKKLADDMIETMIAAPGVGLAAPQVGFQKKFFVYDIGEGPVAVANPQIVEESDEWEFDEGCLSVPGVYLPVKRPRNVKLIGQDLNGDPIEIDAVDFHARVLQHETDHLNGKLLISRLNKTERAKAMKIIRMRGIVGS